MKPRRGQKFPADWSEFLALLVKHRVRFLVVGAHALAAHGRPRWTGDFGVEPLRLDVLKSISGVNFPEAWRSRVRTEIAGHTVHVIGRRAYLKNKRSAGRPKDLADIALLEEIAEPKRKRGGR